MPATQLFSALIEVAVNQLLALDPSSHTKLEKLDEKSLQITLKEWPKAIQFRFTDDKVLVTSEIDSDINPCDCAISCDFQTLQELQDSSKITKLIKEERLVLEGDLHVAQGFAELVKNLSIDWEEQLSKYTGDALAHKLVSGANAAQEKLLKLSDELKIMVSEFAIEEKKLTPHKIELIDFSDKVNDIRSDTSRLEIRIHQLEQRLKD